MVGENMPQDKFVGRTNEQEQYKKFLEGGETPWLLSIIGLGGIGKSTLLHQLQEKQTPPDTYTALLDFDEDSSLRTDPLRFLEKLAELVKPHCAVTYFETFTDTLRSSRHQLEELQQQVNQDTHDNNGVTAQSREGTSVAVMQKIRFASQEVYRQVRELVTESFFSLIQSFDLRRLVIMLDTCEWLNELEGWDVGLWLMNEFLPRLHIRLQKQQCYIVVSSRVPLLSKVIDKQDQQVINLSMLEPEAVDEYLAHKGMDDQGLRKQVFEITHGHALIVTTIGTLWQEQLISSTDIGELKAQAQEKIQQFNEKALMEYTNVRILSRLEFPYKELTQFGVLLRSFNLPFLREVFPNFLLKKSSTEPDLLSQTEVRERFDHFIRYPYIVPLGNYRYAFHELLREAMAEQTQSDYPDEWKSYHKLALDYLVRISPQSVDTYYHAIGSDEEKGMLLWKQALYSRGKREYLAELLQVAFDKTLRLSPAALAVRAYERGRFFHYGIDSQDLNAALENYQTSFELFKQVGDQLGEATALQAIGDVRRTRSETNEAQKNDAIRRAEQSAALESYKQALELF